MTLTPDITRQKYLGEDGSPREYVTINPGPRPPKSIAEWTEQAIARLSLVARSPGGRVVVGLLVDGEPVVKSGRDLSAEQRYAVLRCLDALRDRASETFPAARGMVTRLRVAWVDAYGDEAPRVLS